MRTGDFSSLRTQFLDPLTAHPDPNNPSATIRDPFPGNMIPTARISPQAAFFLPFYPTANTALGTFNYAPTRRSDADKFDIRADHHFSVSDILTGSYSINEVEVFTPGSFAANGAVTQQNRRQRFGASETHSFSPSMMNEFRVNYVRLRFQNAPQGLGENYTVKSGIGGFAEQSSDFPGFPGLGITGYLGFNPNAFSPIKFRDNKYEISDSLSWIRGAHTLKIGVLLRKYDTNTTNAAPAAAISPSMARTQGTHSPTSCSAFHFRGAAQFPRNAFGIAPLRNEHFFVQDDWKVTPNLTLIWVYATS